MTEYLSTDPEEGKAAKLAGGLEATMQAGAPEGTWEHYRAKIKEALFGSEDRAEAKAAGVGLQPTPAELVQGAGMIAAPIAAPGVMAAAGRGVAAVGGAGNIAARTISGAQGAKRGYRTAGPVGAVAGGVLGAMNPVSTGAIEGAISGAESGGVPGAVGGAVLGTVMGGGASKIAKIAALAKTAEAVADAGKVAKATKAVQTAEEAKSLFDAAKAIRTFAKASGSKKMGEKIWMLLDEAGKPLKTLTPDQAAAAKRAGKATTWVANTWS